jgi:hypothetical protein
VVCHGIPNEKPLRDGDIVNIDVTPILDGWHGDTSRMFLVGDVGAALVRDVRELAHGARHLRVHRVHVAAEVLPGSVAAHRDNLLGPELLGCEHRQQAHSPVPDHHDRLPESGLGGHRGEPSGSQHV